MQDGVENPAAGMAVVSNALRTLYSGDVVDVAVSTDLVGALPRVMDRAFAVTPSCPFRTFEESLIGFAKALYALRVGGGRCTAPGVPSGCALYDPHGLYNSPEAREIVYTGGPREYPGRIPASYGIDYFEVVLHPASDGQSLVLEFAPPAGGEARFGVQVWRLADVGQGTGAQRAPQPVAASEMLAAEDQDGRIRYTIPSIDVSEFNRLGLIITRLDSNEGLDPEGAYSVSVGPAAEG
jgi:hypothetical protein